MSDSGPSESRGRATTHDANSDGIPDNGWDVYTRRFSSRRNTTDPQPRGHQTGGVERAEVGRISRLRTTPPSRLTDLEQPAGGVTIRPF